MATAASAPALDPPTLASATPAWRVRIFGISWLAYFSYYFTRKNFSVVKSSLGLSLSTLQWIDFAYLTGYMVGQFASGVLGETLGPRLLVSLGMLASAVLTVLFAFSDSLLTQVVIAYLVISALNGLVQATGWPGNARLMVSWFSNARRAQIMGAWSTCYQAGGVAATLLAALLLGVSTWKIMYLCMAAWVAMVGSSYWFLVRNQPTDVGFADPNLRAGALPRSSAALHADQKAAKRALMRNPMTYAFGTCYFAMKFIRYGFALWLPFYLKVGLGYSAAEAASLSIAFELGGIPFAIIAGSVADRLLGRRRVLVGCTAAFLLFGALMLYRSFASSGAAPQFSLLMLVGACLFACDTLISGAAAQDLGGPDAAGLACGVVNGIGSAGAVAQSLGLVAWQKAYGWDGVFQVFQWMAILAGVVLLPYIRVRPKD